MKKSLALLVLSVFALGLLAACGGDAPSSAPSVASSAPPASSASASEPEPVSSSIPEPEPEPEWNPADNGYEQWTLNAPEDLPYDIWMPSDFMGFPTTGNPSAIGVLSGDLVTNIPQLYLSFGAAEPELFNYTVEGFAERVNAADPNYVCLSIDPWVIGGQDGIKISGTTVSKEVPVQQDRYMVNHGDNVYVFSYTTSLEEIGDDRGDRMVSTVVFKEA